MGDIHGGVFFAIGAVLSGVSYFLGEKYKLFMFIGLVFMAYGVVKVFINKKSKAEIIKDLKAKPTTVYSGGYCPSCKTELVPYSRFCHMCGIRIR